MGFYADKRYINNVNSSILWFAPIAMTIMTIYIYQYIYKETEIEVENIYTFLNIFIKINGPIRNIPTTLQTLYETYVSMKRIGNFLKCSEENEGISYYENNNIDLKNKGIMVKIEKGAFTWGKVKSNNNNLENNNNIIKNKSISIKKNVDIAMEIKSIDKQTLIPDYEEEETKDMRNLRENSIESLNNNTFELAKTLKYDFSEESIVDNQNGLFIPEIVLKNINLTINKGELVVIYGKSGSGKTSLLEAILNEMKFVTNTENKFNVIMTVNGKTSYVSQIPFIYNSTVRQNIAFDLSEEVKLNYDRYFNVIDICSLREDIEELKGGDLTEIGENGINLSSGQIRRIAIARCLYSKKDIYLFDQPTFNIDKKAGWKILYDGVFQFLKNKTRIVVTNKEEFAKYADKIIILKNGEILFKGSYYDLCDSNINFKEESLNFNFYERRINENNDYHPTKSSERFEPTSSSSSVNIEDEITSSNGLICHDIVKKKSTQKALIYKTTKDEKQSTYRYRLSTFSAPIPYLEGLKLVIITCFLIFEWQLTINGSDLWMVFWNNNQGHGLKKNWRYLVVYASFGLLGALCVYLRNRYTCK